MLRRGSALTRLPSELTAACLTVTLSEIVYLGYFVRQFPLLTYYAVGTDMGGITGHSHAGFTAFVALFSLLFLLLAISLPLLSSLPPKQGLAVVLVAGGIFAATMTLVYPVTATDIYTYVAQSRIMVLHHQNPIFVPPSFFPADPTTRMTGEWQSLGSPYGPLGIVLNGIPTLLVGSNLLANLLLLKGMMSLAVLADAYLVYLILRSVAPRFAVTGAALVAWNPLLLFEACANGHNDVLMMFLALLGLYSVVKGDFALGMVTVAASGLVKYATLALLPLVLVHVMRRLVGIWPRLRFLLTSGLGSLAVVTVAYWPFWEGPTTLTRSLLENQLHLESLDSVLVTVLPGVFNLGSATALGRVLFVPVYCLAMYLAMRNRAGLLVGSYLGTFFLLALAVTNFKIWYAVWPVLLAATSDRWVIRLSGLLLAWGATLSAASYGYVWVWLGLDRASSFTHVNAAAYLISFLPATCVLLIWRRKRSGDEPEGGPDFFVRTAVEVS